MTRSLDFDDPAVTVELSGWLQDPEVRVVGIDGFPTSGKTPLARRLSSALSLPQVDVDPHLREGRTSFSGGLEVESLRAAIDAASRPLLVSSVCLLAVAERLALDVDRLIYVKRVSNGYWNAGRMYIRGPDDFDVSYAWKGLAADAFPLVFKQRRWRAILSRPLACAGGGSFSDRE